MAIWIHNEIKSDAEFLFRRIEEQREYIRQINSSDRSPERKKELVESATYLKNLYQQQLGEYSTKGLIAFI